MGRDIPTVINHVIQTLLNHISQILRQHFGRFCLINRRNSLAGFRNLRKLAAQLTIDYLFIKAMA